MELVNLFRKSLQATQTILRKNTKLLLKGIFFKTGLQLAVHVANEDQLKAIFVYIHTNPVLLIEPKWKESGIKNFQKVKEFLEEYKWSSYQDYLGKKNFPSVIEKNFLLKVIGGEKEAQNLITDWLKFKKEVRELLEKCAPISLES